MLKGKDLVHIGLVMAAIAGSATAVLAGYGPRFLVEYDTDRQGGDYTSLNVANFQQCLDSCVNDSKCKACTYVSPYKQPPNYNNSSPRCWLKQTVPGQRAEQGMISAVRQ